MGLISLQSLLFLSILRSRTDVKIAVAYFIPALTGGLLWLVGISSPLFSSTLTLLGLLMKLGLFPFHGWALTVCLGLSTFDLFLFLGPLKLGLLYLAIFETTVPVFLSLCSLLTGLCY